MNREKEIEIIIKFLEADTKLTAQKYPNSFGKTIVTNGKLIESYNNELKDIKEAKNK